MEDIIYTVEIHTGKKFGAGTDADVFLTLYGEFGRSVEFALDKKGVNNFEKGKVDIFDLSFPYNLGPIGKIKIRHDGSGVGAGWFLEKVVVKESISSDIYEFTCHRWLDEGEDDKLICRELLCSSLDKTSKLYENLTTDAGKEFYEIAMTEKVIPIVSPLEVESETSHMDTKFKNIDESITDNNSNGSSSSCDTNDFMMVSKSDVSVEVDDDNNDTSKSYDIGIEKDIPDTEINEDIEFNDNILDSNKTNNPFTGWQKNTTELSTNFDKEIENIDYHDNKTESIIENIETSDLEQEPEVSVNIDNIQSISQSEPSFEVNFDTHLKSDATEEDTVEQKTTESVEDVIDSETVLELKSEKPKIENINDDITSIEFVTGEDENDDKNLIENIISNEDTINSKLSDVKDNDSASSYIEVNKEDIAVESVQIEDTSSIEEETKSLTPSKEEELQSESKITDGNNDASSFIEVINEDIAEKVTESLIPSNEKELEFESKITDDNNDASSFIEVIKDDIAEKVTESIIPSVEDTLSSQATILNENSSTSSYIEVCKEDITEESPQIEDINSNTEEIESIIPTIEDSLKSEKLIISDNSATSSYIELNKEDVCSEPAHVEDVELNEASFIEVHQATTSPDHFEKNDSDLDSIEIIEAPTSLLAESIKEQISSGFNDVSVNEVTETIEKVEVKDNLAQPEIIKEETAPVTNIIIEESVADIEKDIETTIDVLGNGKLMKTIITPGKGKDSRPQSGEQVIISYEGCTEDGKIIDSAKECNLFIQEGDVILGLDLAVSLMELGEVASIKVAPNLAYGDIGRAPDIDANSTLIYKVTLVDNLGKPDFGSMAFKNRLEIAEKKRNRGNELFNRKDFGPAINSYTSAQKILEEDSKLSVEEKSEVDSCLVKCLNNQAICQLKIDAYDAALKSCESVLKTDPKNVKAMFRKGKALFLKGDYKNAVKSLSDASKLDPSNKEIAKELKDAKEKLLAEEKKCKDMYQKMLGTESKETSPVKENPENHNNKEPFPMWALCSGMSFAAGIAVISWAIYQIFSGDE